MRWAATLHGAEGPFADLLEKFDPAEEGNVIDIFRELVTTTAARATKQAVKDLSEATHDTMERLSKSMAVIEKVAAVEEARLSEAAKGHRQGSRARIQYRDAAGRAGECDWRQP